jgi:hypothetical protein
MKIQWFSLLSLPLACALAQPPAGSSTVPLPANAVPPTVAPETVVAIVDGKPVTAKELDRLMENLPPQIRQGFKQNPQVALMQFKMIESLSDEAVSMKLHEEEPLKTLLELRRREALAQERINYFNNHIVVRPDEEEAFYEKNKDRFESATISVIYVAMTPAGQSVPDPKPGEKKPLTEAEAESKAKDLRKQLDGGADFKKLAETQSDDRDSAAKGGTWATIRRSDKLPDAVKNAVFALKVGEISQPVKQANGFYLFKVDARTAQPIAEVRTQIFNDLKTQRFQEWFGNLQRRFQVKIEKPEFFAR